MGGEAGRAPSGGLRSCACSRTGWGRHHHHHHRDGDDRDGDGNGDDDDDRDGDDNDDRDGDDNQQSGHQSPAQQESLNSKQFKTWHSELQLDAHLTQTSNTYTTKPTYYH